jgi:hypothetical protein
VQRKSHFQITGIQATFKLFHKKYRLCDSKTYRTTYNMTSYSGRDRKRAPQSMTTTDVTVTRLKMWDTNCTLVNSSPELFNDLHIETTNCCGTVRPNTKVTTRSTGHKMKLKQSAIWTRVKGNLTALMWKDKTQCKHTNKYVFSISRG